jgi:hypothetical protein
MAVNYYEGWTEAALLALRRQVQETLATGQVAEVTLAGERTRVADATLTPPEVTLERIAYALYVLYAAGSTATAYANPYSYQPGTTIQSFY